MASQGQQGAGRAGLGERKRGGGDTVLAIGRAKEKEEENKQTGVVGCGSTR